MNIFLSSLFDNPDEDMLFRWLTSIRLHLSLNSDSISKKRLASCILESHRLYFDASLGFVEIKPVSYNENKQAISKDLIRLGMLSKNSIDKWPMRGCLAAQIVGYEVTFYLTTQPSPELYTMLELCIISIPSCLARLLAYLTKVEDTAAFLQCYNNWRVHFSSDQPHQHERELLDH
ncbi:hypothetical protein BCV72DRAFT_298421 [Rhizopus microsporus var. microsporus]|uniref:Uncharacterized protein n=1 Tax=Rhizopus microsporus var. microsporus TaxID=86635 RepID=A0A1X0QQK6_RHIZD|nr:hypothetical protein BCV72DRAFT_298421 [Rhizopus microsporus var. microsporus]